VNKESVQNGSQKEKVFWGGGGGGWERKNELQKYTNLTKCKVAEKGHRSLEIGRIKVYLRMERD